MKLVYSLLVFLISVACTLSAGVYRVRVDEIDLNVRKEATTKSDIVGHLKDGQYIYATSVSNGWAKFHKGYASTNYLIKVSNGDGTDYKTNDNLNFRTGPSTDYKIITTLKKGTTVSYFGKDPFNSEWAVTNQGYASLKYLDKVGGKKSSTKSSKSTATKTSKSTATSTSKSSTSGVYRVRVDKIDLNIRKEATTKSDIVGKLKDGQYIYAISVSNGWAKFYKGHCSMDYLVKVSDGTECATNADLNFRTGPSTDYKIITTLKKGTNVTYFDSDPFTSNWAVTNKGYANVKYLNIGDGKQSTTSNNTSSSAGAGVYRVNVKETNLNIRKEPTTSSEIVGKLKNGQYIYVTSVSNGWAKFYKGYSSMDYLIKENDDLSAVTDANKYVTNTNVNFKAGPSDSYETLVTVNSGTNVIYYDIDPFTLDWAVTNIGYANMQYLNNAGNGQSTINTLNPTDNEQSIIDSDASFTAGINSISLIVVSLLLLLRLDLLI